MAKANRELSKMSADERGLSSTEAAERQNRVGPNAITEKHANLLIRVGVYFGGPIPWMIEVAALLSGAVGRWDDFGVIVFMLLIYAGVGFFEEKNANDAIVALKQKLAPIARVRCDGA